MAASADISLLISVVDTDFNATKSENAAPHFTSERRITPTWTLRQLKAKLETMTGIPPSSQQLKLRAPGRADVWMDDGGEERVVGDWGLFKGCEIVVHDRRPPSARPNFTDVSAVEKYTLPVDRYEALSDSVLAWKKRAHLGRFDPAAKSPHQLAREHAEKDAAGVKQRDIAVGRRSIILPSTPPHIRRGVIRFVGPVPTIPSPFAKALADAANTHAEGAGDADDLPAPLWVGIELDEPLGKNDGSVGGQRYFECLQNRGVFVKPDKVEIGDFPPLGLDELDEEI